MKTKSFLRRARQSWAMLLHLFLLHNIITLFLTSAVFADHVNIVEEYATCDHIIPKFIKQVMNQRDASCERPGEYPKPGNCTVFFRCVLSDAGSSQLLVEYCATGYNFVNGVCVPNRNVSDCPQYTCRIPDGANQIGNEIELNHDNDRNIENDSAMSAPLVISTSEPESILKSETTIMPIEEVEESTIKYVVREETVHWEQLMSETQSQPNKNSGTDSLTILFFPWYFFLCFTFHILI